MCEHGIVGPSGLVLVLEEIPVRCMCVHTLMMDNPARDYRLTNPLRDRRGGGGEKITLTCQRADDTQANILSWQTNQISIDAPTPSTSPYGL